jgi:hypothetical protein
MKLPKNLNIAKLTFISILIIALGSGCFFAGKNWDSWFPELAEVPYNQVPQPPKSEHNPGPRGVEKPVSSKTSPVTNPPKETNPPEDANPPKTPPTEIPKVTPPLKEIPKVTPQTKKTLTPAERYAIYKEIEKDVKAGKCDRDCIMNKVKEFLFSSSDAHSLMSQMP